jgi:ABC-type sulfate transport system substrate-binding protein
MSKGETAAKQFVTKVFDNVEIMPRDAREASDVFYNQKFGDALLTYENEAVFTNLVVSPKAPLPYISPDNNVRITCPAALVDRNIDAQPAEVRDAAEAFVNYLFTPVAQKEFVACGFRSTNKAAAAEREAPKVKYVWEVEKRLGDWVTVQKKFFDEGVSYIN